MRIRLATSADRTDMVRMGLQFIAESGYRGLLTPNPLAQEACVETLIEQGGAWVLETDGGLVVGMLGIALVHLPVSLELAGSELMWWIDPQWRRGTWGMRLYKIGEQWARDKGAVWLQMLQPFGNPRVGEFYRRQGHMPVETVWQKRLAA